MHHHLPEWVWRSYNAVFPQQNNWICFSSKGEQGNRNGDAYEKLSGEEPQQYNKRTKKGQNALYDWVKTHYC